MRRTGLRGIRSGELAGTDNAHPLGMAFVPRSIASRKLGEEPLVRARRIRSVQEERLRLRDLTFFEDGLVVSILASWDCPDPLEEEFVLGEVYSLPDARLFRGGGVPIRDRGGEA